MSTAVVTYLYSQALPYVNGFLQNLQQQENTAFTLLVFNDGVENPDLYFAQAGVEARIIPVAGTPTEIRFFAFDYLKRAEYDFVVFQDIDDEMSANRVRTLTALLSNYPVVCNDIVLMDESGKRDTVPVWGSRLGNEFVFDYTFITGKNILGIGNSAIRKSALETPLAYSSKPMVADWFMYYQLLQRSAIKAVFTTECQTYYRQHQHNMAGIRALTPRRLEYVIKVKQAHYEALNEVGFNMQEELNEMNHLAGESGHTILQDKNAANLFWWEETDYIKPTAKL